MHKDIILTLGNVESVLSSFHLGIHWNMPLKQGMSKNVHTSAYCTAQALSKIHSV